MRVWLNGRLVHETTQLLGFEWSLDRVPVTLRAGRNTLLVKVNNGIGPCYFRLRLADGPIDRAFALAEMGLWDEAAEQMRQANPHRIRDAWLSVRFAQLLLAAGDVEGYRRQCEWMLQQFENSASPLEACNLAWACTLAPDVAPDAERLVRIAELGRDPSPAERYRIGVLGGALYRAGRFDEAIKRLGEISDVRNPVSDLVLAMAHHGKGDTDKARELLEKAQTWYDAATREALTAPTYDLPHWHWNEFVDFQILYREARALIEGTSAVQDKNAADLLARAREELARRDPLTAEFDHAVMVQPNEPRLWLARGRRLAELGRWGEAEADFNKAVELKPDDLDALLARARFHAERGDVAEARDEYAAALQLPGKGWWTTGRVVEREIGLYGDVLDELQKRDPRTAQLWRIRGERQMRLGQWREAVQSLSSSDPDVYHESYIALLCTLLGDQSGHQAACLRDDELIGQRPDEMQYYSHLRALSAWPGPDHASELKRLMEAHREFVPTARWYRVLTGLALYRGAQYQPALELLEQSLNPAAEWQSDAAAWPLLAMTHWQLGQQAEARKWLARSEWWVEWTQRAADNPQSVGPNGAPHAEWLQAHVYYREAKALIDGREAAEQALARLAKLAQERRQEARSCPAASD
jgi:tetratricopeptide (TPR) repeat protein